MVEDVEVLVEVLDEVDFAVEVLELLEDVEDVLVMATCGLTMP